MCLIEQPKLFVKFVEDFDKLPEAVADYITNKFQVILRETIFKDIDSLQMNFRELYKLYEKDPLKESSRYKKLLNSFYTVLREQSNIIKMLIMDQINSFFCKSRDTSIYDKLTVVYQNLYEICDYLVEANFECKFNHVELKLILMFNSISNQFFVLAIFANKNNKDQRRETNMESILNEILKTPSIADNTYEFFHNDDFKNQLTRQLNKLDPYKGEQYPVFVPYLV